MCANDSRGRRKKPQLTQTSRHRSPSTIRCFAKYNLITSSIRIRIRKERERDEPASLVVAHKRFPFHNLLGQSSVIGTAFRNQVCEIVIITSTRNNQWPYQLLDSLPSGNMTMPASQPTKAFQIRSLKPFSIHPFQSQRHNHACSAIAFCTWRAWVVSSQASAAIRLF